MTELVFLLVALGYVECPNPRLVGHAETPRNGIVVVAGLSAEAVVTLGPTKMPWPWIEYVDGSAPYATIHLAGLAAAGSAVPVAVDGRGIGTIGVGDAASQVVRPDQSTLAAWVPPGRHFDAPFIFAKSTPALPAGWLIPAAETPPTWFPIAISGNGEMQLSNGCGSAVPWPLDPATELSGSHVGPSGVVTELPPLAVLAN